MTSCTCQLVAKYFDAYTTSPLDFSALKVVRPEYNVRLISTDGAPIDTLGGNTWGVVLQGFFRSRSSGFYELHPNQGSGLAFIMYFNGTKTANNQWPTTVYLEAGVSYRVKFQYYDSSSFASMFLKVPCRIAPTVRFC